MTVFTIQSTKVAGLGDLLPPEHVRAHLESIYKYNFKRFEDGKWGPILQCPLGGWDSSEGGVQVDEVLLGSTWSCIGLMLRYGLTAEAKEIAEIVSSILYGKSGLQFRTPVAWTKDKGYRGPLNMRPLAIWYLSKV